MPSQQAGFKNHYHRISNGIDSLDLKAGYAFVFICNECWINQIQIFGVCSSHRWKALLNTSGIYDGNSLSHCVGVNFTQMRAAIQCYFRAPLMT